MEYNLKHLHMYGPFKLGLYGNGAHWFVTDDYGSLVRVLLPKDELEMSHRYNK